MQTRTLVVALVALLVAGPVAAQRATGVHRIGYLTIAPRDTQAHLIDAFEQGLAERGYTVGRDVVVEYRFADGNPERLPALAQDLVHAKVDVIVTGINPNIRAAQRATKSIPVVAAISYFPVEEGLVQSLARPGGNVTGLTSDVAGEVGKRLQILREAVPRLSKVAVLYGAGEEYVARSLAKLQDAARTLGVTLVTIEVRSGDVDAAWARVEQSNADALIGFGAFALSTRGTVIRNATKARMPTMFSDKQYVDDGALLAYGPDLTENWRKAAGYVDRILKGAKPADLPFEQPVRYVFAINLKTARALGITIPQGILMQATHRVE